MASLPPDPSCVPGPGISDEIPPTEVVLIPLSLCDLPIDVLLKVFALLPLRTVLQLERLSRRLCQCVSAYLTTLKSLNLYHERMREDAFRGFNPQVIGDGCLSDKQFTFLLDRCPNVTSIVFLPDLGVTAEPAAGLSIAGIVAALTAQSRITKLGYCNSARLSNAVFNSLPHVAMDTLSLQPHQPFSILPSWNIRRLQIQGGTILGTLPSLLNVEDIEIQGTTVKIAAPSGGHTEHTTRPEFPKLRSFSCSVRLTRASFGQHDTFSSMLVAVAMSPHLTCLKLSLEDFSCLDRVSEDGRLLRLRVFVLSSSGLYTAAFQQRNHAGVVAELCASNARTLEHLSLPSSILVKQFFQHFISNDCHLPELWKLETNGIADTKLFLAPGSLVEKRYYQQFLGLCPKMTSLSLHAYSGSLPTLSLPLGLTELTLPWDNRLNMQNQQATIYAVVDGLPILQRLSIAGIEEVEGVMQVYSSVSRGMISLRFSCESLTDFSISNVCTRGIDLSDCRNLSRFALHCCPALKTLHLPAVSMEQVSIYNNSLPEFLLDFISRQLHCKPPTPVCHLHIQLHAVANDSDARPFAMVAEEAFTYVSSVLRAVANQVDYCILKRLHVKRLEHNSGESMYACTEFQEGNCNDFSRSKEEVLEENAHRAYVLEGVRRWTECLAGMRSLIASKEVGAQSLVEQKFDAVYCGQEYGCCTNVPWILEMNKSQRLTQPSSPGRTVSRAVTPGKLVRLNVPRLDVTPSQCVDILQHSVAVAGVAQSEPTALAKPLLFVSITEYLHNVHTLFYYS